MKKTILFFLLIGVIRVVAYEYNVTEENQKRSDQLRQALLATRESDYITTIEHPAFPEFPRATKAVFYRQFNRQKNIVMHRLDLYAADGKKLYSLIQNEDGQFAVSHQFNFAVYGGDFLRLFYLEELGKEFYESVMTYSHYSQKSLLWEGRKATRVVVSLPDEIHDDDKVLRGMTGMYGELDDFKRNYPYKRVYTIDNKTGVVVSCSTYNSQGKKKSKISLGKTQFAPDWKSEKGIFDTPRSILCEALSVDELLSMELWHAVHPKVSTADKVSSFAKEILQWGLRHGWVVFSSIGGVCLIFILALRIREKYRK